MTIETPKIHYLYRIFNKINSKIYIGQTIEPTKRWYQHRRDSENPSPVMMIGHAIKKYGVENFEYEVIAICNSQDNANEIETLLVSQYESHISAGKGYNVSLGGWNAPKSEAWKQKMREWHASMPIEEKAERAKVLSEARIGIQYSKQTLEKMSSAKIGTKLSEEHKQNISINNSRFWTGKRLHKNTLRASVKARIKTTPEQELEIIEKFKSGANISSLAREYKVDRSVVRRVIKYVIQRSIS